jgi:Fic family protein
MDACDFTQSTAGTIMPTLDGHQAFVPSAPPLFTGWDDSLATTLSRADIALGMLCGLGENLPNPHLLVNPFARREAVLSSRIEGTVSSLSDLLEYEAREGQSRDAREVSNYVRALEYGLQRLQELPISLRLIRELHAILLDGVRGAEARPGQFRDRQNWIGSPGSSIEEAVYVPPPVIEMMSCLDAFERFVQNGRQTPVLVHAAMMHWFFEAIHPFIDGNGRVGRLLIILFLCERGVLTKPLLYLSAFFEANRAEYYDLLLDVSRHGRWREWLLYFLRGVAVQSEDAVRRARRLLELHRHYLDSAVARRVPASAMRLIELIFMRPVLNIRMATDYLGVSFPAASKAVALLEEAGMLEEISGGRRNRMYRAAEVMDVLERDPAT